MSTCADLPTATGSGRPALAEDRLTRGWQGEGGAPVSVARQWGRT